MFFGGGGGGGVKFEVSRKNIKFLCGGGEGVEVQAIREAVWYEGHTLSAKGMGMKGCCLLVSCSICWRLFLLQY